MELFFQGGNETFQFVIDRKNKKLKIACSKTSYALMDQPWKKLFDPGKEKMQEKITDTYTDEEFKANIITDMQKVGYSFKGEK